MTGKSSYDILLDYPMSKGLDYDSNNNTTRFFLSPNEPFLNTKYVLFKIDKVIFFAYDSYGARMSMTKTFSGIYTIFPYNSDIDIRILKRDLLDKIFIWKRKLTGDKFIDKKITIKSKNSYPVKRIFRKEDVKRYLKLYDKIPPIELMIKSNFLNMIEVFKGKNVIGLETNEWIYNHDTIDYLIDYGGLLINDMIKNTSG